MFPDFVADINTNEIPKSEEESKAVIARKENNF